MCTDGIPSIQGKEKGLFGLMKKGEEIQNFISFHCIIHQESLVSKLHTNGNNTFHNVMQTDFRVTNYFISERSLRTVTGYDDLLMHSEVRWLSRGKILEQFLSHLPEICTFLDSKGKWEPELEYPC